MLILLPQLLQVIAELLQSFSSSIKQLSSHHRLVLHDAFAK
jgi:hypothetical protein